VPWLITQRPAVIHKDVLSQLDTLIAMKLTSSQDRNALDAWIEGQADKAEQKRIYAALPGLSVGEGIIWSPGHSMLKQAKFNMIRTFDSSRTPKRGERVKAPAGRAAVDLDAIRAKLATVETEAADNDPKALKARIRELERQANQPGSSAAELDNAHTNGYHAGEAAGVARGYRDGFTAGIDRMRSELVTMAQGLHISPPADVPGTMSRNPASFDAPKRDISRAVAEVRKPAPNYARSDAPGEHKAFARASERKIMVALAQYPEGLNVRKLGIITGYAYTGGTFKNAIGANRSAGRIEGGSDHMRITPKGFADLGRFDPLPTGNALYEHWRQNLDRASEKEILRVVVEAYPKPITPAQIGAATNPPYESTGGTFKNAVGKLRTLGLIEGRGDIRASDHLFG
jgi:hypothetical protein